MGRDWESTFREWSKPSCETEATKCDNAVRMIRDAIKESRLFEEMSMEVFAQGSYRNNTNVRQESDVDVCVRCMKICYPDFSCAEGLTRKDVGLVDVNYTYAQFKDNVGKALVAKFGSQGITRGKKAFDVHPNSYRVDADVVPTFEHRRYTRKESGEYRYLSGTEFRTDNGGQIVNWPQQHYDNGVSKNKETGNRFKFIVRVLKRLRNDMAERGIDAAKPISSYLIECLVWNTSNDAFNHEEYVENVHTVLGATIYNTALFERCKEWGEVNELKYLFRPAQPWTQEQAYNFLTAAWKYIQST